MFITCTIRTPSKATAHVNGLPVMDNDHGYVKNASYYSGQTSVQVKKRANVDADVLNHIDLKALINIKLTLTLCFC